EADLKFQFTANQIERAIPAEDRKLNEELKKKVAAMEKRMPDRPQTFGFYSPATSPTPIDVLPMKGFYPLPYRPEELKRNRPHLLVAGEVHRRGPALDVGWPAVFGPVPNAANAGIDPENRLWWRWSPRRLEAEAVRDAMLAVSGELDLRAGGASDQDTARSLRRSLYLFQRRGKAPAFQPLFDGPNAVPE